MLENLQNSEPAYSNMKSKLESGQIDENFVLINRILYKKVLICSQETHQLCLPTFLATDILQSEHLRNSQHLQVKPLTDRFACLFYVPNLMEKEVRLLNHV